MGEKAPSITLSQLRVLLEVILSLRRYDAGSAIELFLLIQKKNHSTYLSHEKEGLMNKTDHLKFL